MLAQRKVALRVNGLRVTKARVCRGEAGAELIITYPLLGEFAADGGFSLEMLELLCPPEMRKRLPNGGWRKVPLRILIALLRSGVIVVAGEERAE